MQKHKKKTKKEGIAGSETILERIKRKTPWIFGKMLRKPKIIFPHFKRRRSLIRVGTRSLSFITTLLILFVLQTGIVYLLVRKPPSIGVDEENKPMFVWERNIHEAFIIESIVGSILMLLFSFGFILLYHASKFVYNKKFADWIIVIGVLMIIINFVLLQLILRVKVPKPVV